MSAGSIAQVTGSGQGLPGTSWALNDFGSITTDVDSILSESAGVFTPQEQGYYLIIAESKFDSTHSNRLDIEQKIQKNSTDYAGAVGSDYSRNATNDKSWQRSSMVAYFNGSTDDFEIQDRRDSGAGTPAGAYTWTRIKVVQLSAGDSDSLAYGHYGTPTSAAHAAAGAPDASSVVDGWDVITENDTASIELQAGGTDITLKKTDRPYLVLYGLPTDATGVGRTFRMADLTFGGTRINHSFGHAYQRDANNQYAVPEGMALVAPSSSDDLNARIWLYEDNKATHWGTCNGEAWTLSSAAGRAGIMVVELPAGTDFAIFDDATANQTWNSSATLDLNFAATESDAGTNFTRDSATAVSVDAAANVMAYAAYFVERTASSGTRLSNAARWEVEGVDKTTETEFGQYMRGEQGADDEKNTALGVTHIFAAAANDTLNLEKFDPGTDDGNNDVTSMGGAFFIDLDSLAATATLDVEQEAFAFYQAGTESGATIIGSQDTAITMPDADFNITLRVGLSVTGVALPSTADYRLRFQKNGFGFFGVASGGSSINMRVDSNITEGAATTERLAGPQTFSAGKCKSHAATSQIDNLAVPADRDTELVWCISGLASGMAVDDVFQFKVQYHNGTAWVDCDTLSVVPQITIVAGGNDYDETGRTVAIAATITPADDQAHSELSAPVAITATITVPTEVHGVYVDETGRLVAVSAGIAVTDTADFTDSVNVAIVAGIQVNDSPGAGSYQELARAVSIEASITTYDSIGWLEETTCAALASVAVNDTWDAVDSVSVPVTASIVVADSHGFTESPSVSIAATITVPTETYTGTLSIAMTHFGFYNDGTETGATIIGSIDTGASIPDADKVFLLRLGLTVSGAALLSSADIRLRYEKNDAGTYYAVASGSDIAMALSSNLTDYQATTDRLGGTGTFVAGAVRETDEVTSLFTNPFSSGLAISERSELVWVLKAKAAGLSVNDYIKFKFQYDNGGGWTDVDVEDVTPQLTIGSNSYEEDDRPVAITASVTVTDDWTPAAAYTKQVAFQFYNDDGSESASTTAAAKDTGITVTDVDQLKRLRIEIESIGAAMDSDTDWRLAYSKNSGTYEILGSGNDIASGLTSYYSQGDATTKRLSTATNWTAGECQTTDNVHSGIFDRALASKYFTEHEWCLDLQAGGMSDGDTYDFKVQVKPDGGTYQDVDETIVLPRITVSSQTGGGSELNLPVAIQATISIASEVFSSDSTPKLPGTDSGGFQLETLISDTSGVWGSQEIMVQCSDIAGLNRSTDGGKSWYTVNRGFFAEDHYGAIGFLFSKYDKGVAYYIGVPNSQGGTMYLFKSTNFDAADPDDITWTLLDSQSGAANKRAGLPYTRTHSRQIAEYETGGDHYLLIASYDGVWLSVNDGNMTQRALNNYRITSIVTDPNNDQDVFLASDIGTSPGVYRMDNAFTGTLNTYLIGSSNHLDEGIEICAVDNGGTTELVLACNPRALNSQGNVYHGTSDPSTATQESHVTWTEKTPDVSGSGASLYDSIDAKYDGSDLHVIVGAAKESSASGGPWYGLIVISEDFDNASPTWLKTPSADSHITDEVYGISPPLKSWWYELRDGGWRPNRGTFDAMCVRFNPNDDTQAWAAGDNLQFTADYTATAPEWQPAVNGMTCQLARSIHVDPSDDDKMVAGTTDFTQMSTDDGWLRALSWDDDDVGNLYNDTGLCAYYHPDADGKIVTGREEGGVTWYTNVYPGWGEQNWTGEVKQDAGNQVYGIVYFDDASGNEITVAYVGGSGFRRSVNKGAFSTVSSMTTGTQANKIAQGVYAGGGVGYFYIPTYGLVRFTNYGTSWTRVWAKTGNSAFTGYLDYDQDGYLWVMANKQLWKVTDPDDGTLNADGTNNTGSVVATQIRSSTFTRIGAGAAHPTEGGNFGVLNDASSSDDSEFWVTKDGGSTWTDEANGEFRRTGNVLTLMADCDSQGKVWFASKGNNIYPLQTTMGSGTYTELSLPVSITALTPCFDEQAMVEDVTVAVTAGVAVTDELATSEDVTVAIVATIDVTDDLTDVTQYDETGRAVAIVATVTVPTEIHTFGTLYDETGRTVSITATVESVDTPPPPPVRIWPANLQVINATTVRIHGTATDNEEVSLVEIRIYDRDSTEYWDGSAWAGTSIIWLECDLSAPDTWKTDWEYVFDLGSVPLPIEQYWYTVRVWDNNGQNSGASGLTGNFKLVGPYDETDQAVPIACTVTVTDTQTQESGLLTHFAAMIGGL